MKFKLIIDKNAQEEIIATVHAPSSLTAKIENLINSYTGEDSILGNNEDEMRKLSFEEIECITVIDRKVFALDLNGKRYKLQDRLRDLEEILPSYFIRINKSSLANENAIERFEAGFSGAVDAVFKCGFREYVSRRCFSEIRKRYEKL